MKNKSTSTNNKYYFSKFLNDFKCLKMTKVGPIYHRYNVGQWFPRIRGSSGRDVNDRQWIIIMLVILIYLPKCRHVFHIQMPRIWNFSLSHLKLIVILDIESGYLGNNHLMTNQFLVSSTRIKLLSFIEIKKNVRDPIIDL